MNNVCLSKICDENTLCKAHLIPKSFVREIYFSPKNDEKHIIHDIVTEKNYSLIPDKLIKVFYAQNVMVFLVNMKRMRLICLKDFVW